MRRTTTLGTVMACTFVALAQTLPAQTLRGRILDSESGDPVMLAYVGLMAAEGEMVVAALATPDIKVEIDALACAEDGGGRR